jgi:hypothetical protein
MNYLADPDQTAAARDQILLRAPQRPTTSWMQSTVAVTLSATLSAYAWTSPVAAERRHAARAFARIARNMRGVQEVWLNAALPELEVAVILDASDFDRELELRGIFIDLISDLLDPSVGELTIHAADEAQPWIRHGELLT